MIWPYLIAVLSAAFSPIHALVFPTLLNQTAGFPARLTSDWACQTAPFHDPPLYTDCEVAYSQLPVSTNEAIFHQEGEEDGYRLPVEKGYNTCGVTVTLVREHIQDKTSWANIAFKAEILNDLCVNGKNDGGFIKTGQFGRIWVILMNVAGGNRTVGGQVDVT